VFFSVVPAERVEPLLAALRERAGSLSPAERLHASVLPTETFF